MSAAHPQRQDDGLGNYADAGPLDGLTIAVTLDAGQLAELAEHVAAILRPVESKQSKQPPPSKYLNVREAAEFLRCSRQRVHDLLSQRQLTRHKEGSRTLIERAEIEAHVVAHSLPTSPQSRMERGRRR